MEAEAGVRDIVETVCNDVLADEAAHWSIPHHRRVVEKIVDRLAKALVGGIAGLTYAECEAAARNWGIDLTCGECASIFYTGHSSASHDVGCKTEIVERREGPSRG